MPQDTLRMLFYFLPLIFPIASTQLCNGDKYSYIYDRMSIKKNDSLIELFYINRYVQWPPVTCKFHHVQTNTEVVSKSDDKIVAPNSTMRGFQSIVNECADPWKHLPTLQCCNLKIYLPLASDNGDWIVSMEEENVYRNEGPRQATINVQQNIIGLNDNEYHIQRQTTYIKRGVDFTVRSSPVNGKFGYERCWLTSPDKTIYAGSVENRNDDTNCTVRILNANEKHTGTWVWDLYSECEPTEIVEFERYISEQFEIIVVDETTMINLKSSTPKPITTTQVSTSGNEEDKNIATSGIIEEITRLEGKTITVAPEIKETIISNVDTDSMEKDMTSAELIPPEEKTTVIPEPATKIIIKESSTPEPEEITNGGIFESFYVKMIIISAIAVLVISIGIYFKIWTVIWGNNFYTNRI